MADTRMLGSAHGRSSSRMSSSKSVAMTPPKSPAMGRRPSASLIKQVETPATPSRWRTQHDQSMFKQLSFHRLERKDSKLAAKEKAVKLARKIPTDMLAKEWMKENQATLDTRAYLVDQILPTLILGMEKLLVEADERGLTERNLADPDFNPINYLAQYLMRNNPRYSNLLETSPYVRTMREIGDVLKQQIFQLEDNKLARIKNEAKRKREEREKAIEARKYEKKRRNAALLEQFINWAPNSAEEPNNIRVDLALMQSALRSFRDMVEYLPEELQSSAKYTKPIGATDETGQTLSQREFVELITAFVEEFPAALFDQFISHMDRCANAFKGELEREQRKTTLTNLFIVCDHTGVGVLDRHRILSLFESFYDQQKDQIKLSIGLRNPRKWPVVEVDEADSESEDEDLDPAEPTDSTITSVEVTESSITDPVTGTDDVRAKSPANEKHEIETAEKAAAPKADEATEDKDAEAGDVSQATDVEVSLAVDAQPATAEPIPMEADADRDQLDSFVPEPDEEAEAPADPLPADLKVETEKSNLGEKKPPTRGGAFSVSFAEGTNLLQRERTTLETRGTGSQSQMSAFDENTVNMSQFVQMTETFLGGQPALELFQSLCRYMRDGYVETEEEKMARLMRAHKEAQNIKRKARLVVLFDKWDNEGSGYLDIEEVDTIVHKYKDGLEKQAINRGKYRLLTQMKQKTGSTDSRLSQREFSDLMHLIVEEIGGENTFDFFIDFVESCVERTYAEKIRGEARKKWLQQIATSAETSAASLETVYRSVFQALYRDAETHGNGKVISANITMLEQNRAQPARGATLLRYVATTSDDVPIALNKVLHQDMKGISFAAVEAGKPLHVPRVSTHGNIHFWNPDQEESGRDGSFVVIPLKDSKKRVFGTLGVDTLRDPHSKSIFITHEIQFYQGVANSFSRSFHYVDTKRKTMRITESAISWICRRSPNVHEINVYLVEPDGKNEDYVLRRMMVCVGEKADVKSFDTPSRLERKDNLFRDYLFKCVDNSETITADAYGQRHFGFPLRGGDGRVVLVIDISAGDSKQIPGYERKEIIRMLKLVQKAQREITTEYEEGEKNVVLEAEKQNEDVRVEIMFDRLMLQDLRKHVAKLDPKTLAELKHYKTPPDVIRKIVQGTLSLFYPKKDGEKSLDDWAVCKSYIDAELSTKIAEFDPTAEGSELIEVDELESNLREIPHGVVSKHGSKPAESLYGWLYVCLSLIQHCKRTRLGESNRNTNKMLPTGMTPDAAYEDDDE